MKTTFLASLLAASIALSAAPARANITWDWTAGGGLHSGQIVTTGSTPVAGIYTVVNVSVTASSFMPLGSVSTGEYILGSAFNTGGPFTLTWDGSAVTSFDASTSVGVNGLVISDASGDQWAIFGGDSYGTQEPHTWDFASLTGANYGTDLVVTPRSPDIAVQAPGGAPLQDGGAYNFGSVTTGTGTVGTFTIANTGLATLRSLAVTIEAGSDFSVTQQPAATVNAGLSTTFAVTFAPTAGGVRTGSLHIASNDPDENPFDITLSGTGVVDCVVSDWSAWGPCCNGTQTRTRTVLVPAAYGGVACPGLVETQACSMPAIAVTITTPTNGASVSTGVPVSLAATFTDAGGGTHSGTWSVGAASSPATIVEPAGVTAGTATGSWTFATGGSYTITLNLASTCGGSGSAAVNVTVGTTSLPFPATPVLDNFNRPNGTIGPNWIDEPWTFTIQSKKLRHSASTAHIEWKSAVFGPEQEAYVTLSDFESSSMQSLLLKTQGTTWRAGYIEVRYEPRNQRVTVYTFTAPSTTRSAGSISRVRFVVGDRLGARVHGDGRVQIYRNGNLLGTVSVAGWAFAAAGGRIGLVAGGSSTTRADDFGGGTLPAAAAVAAIPPADVQSAPAGPAQPPRLELSGAFPNPTHGRAAFRLSLPEATDVEWSVVDVQGRDVSHEPARRYEPGTWTLSWDGATARGVAPAGLYFARVRAGAHMLLQRVVVVR